MGDLSPLRGIIPTEDTGSTPCEPTVNNGTTEEKPRNTELDNLVSQAKTSGDYLLPLWNQVRSFVYKRAVAALHHIPPEHGLAIEDLLQSGYLAMIGALGTHDREKGSFLAWLDKYLRNEFARAGGYSTSKRDALNFSTSLDVPVPGGDESDETFADILPDSEDAYAEVEDMIYYQQLHDSLENAVSSLPESQAVVIRSRYWHDRKLREIADELGVSKERIRQRETAALKRLRRSAVDTGLSEYIGERVDYYGGGSLRKYRQRGSSSVEQNVIRMESLREEWARHQNETTERD